MARSCNKGLLLKIPAKYYPSPRPESMLRGENLTLAGDHARPSAMLPRAALLRIFRRDFFLH
ncbi:hypothetical protein D0544_12415 [Aestuariirhabdus litorea]|uniref:Uncharacterized protein n=1 Tax=Aestuariirhabdus litorea TaxID=2528527 RepID=A0A3P3VLQ9_9GAMM|nr:hypothetical protein D0544_12415 [Aestuariirhabdus litorea]